MQNINTINWLSGLYKVLTVLCALLCIVAILFAYNLYKEGRLIGAGAGNTIMITGKGEMDIKPDISSITVTLREQSDTSAEAEKNVTKKLEKFLTNLSSSGLVEDRDIKTMNYNSYPRYSYPPNAPVKIDGYEVTQSITLKVRDIDSVGKVLALVSGAGINEVSGPDYTIDDIEKYKDDTRAIAIKDAKQKAEKLADQLGVDLVRIVSFSEGSDYTPPIMYARMDKTMNSAAEAVQAPILPEGENKVSSNVTITFEIK